MATSKTQGIGPVRQITGMVSLVIVCGLLVSCSNPSEITSDTVQETNCDRIFSNLRVLHDRPRVFPNSDFASDRSVAILLGEESRAKAETKILAKFPFLDQIIVGKKKSNQLTDVDLLYPGTIFLVQEAIVGTDIEFPYSTAEVLAIASNENAWDDVVHPMSKEIFGERFGSGPLQGCAIVDANKDEVNAENKTAWAFSRAIDTYKVLSGFLQAIRDCQRTGWHQEVRCSKEDYVSDGDYDYTLSDEKTPEELKILEERKRETQNEEEEESSSREEKGVRPLQVCYTAFVVVPTDKYGDLTCRPVMVNKIRTLMWMK